METDKQRFEQIYRENLRKVEYYLYNYLYDMDLSKSVAQDSFLVLWEKRGQDGIFDNPLPYLLTVSRNRALNILRQKKTKDAFDNHTKYREYLLNRDAIFQPSSISLYANEVNELINKALQKMPKKVRSTFLMSKNENLKNREIAQKEGIAISTVEYRLAYAYKMLRRYLKDYLQIILWFFPAMGLY